jgi:hypothetical protein
VDNLIPDNCRVACQYISIQRPCPSASAGPEFSQPQSKRHIHKIMIAFYFDNQIIRKLSNKKGKPGIPGLPFGFIG